MKTSDLVNQFNANLNFDGKLPEGYRLLNPFKDSKEAQDASTQFNNKFYADTNERTMILNISPSRLGAGLTGIPLTDPHTMDKDCGIKWTGHTAYEPSSAFFYTVIEAYGGAEKFYQNFYVNAVCPLCVEMYNDKGHWVNASYYETAGVRDALTPFIQKTMDEQVTFNINKSRVIYLGSSNADYLTKLNNQKKYFDTIETLPHPRYVEEYHKYEINKFTDEYLKVLNS